MNQQLLAEMSELSHNNTTLKNQKSKKNALASVFLKRLLVLHDFQLID